MNLFGSICLSDIPKELIQTSQSNGKKYITLCINEKKQADEYGNTHYVKIYQRRDPAQPIQNEIYVGNMKASTFDAQPVQAQVPAAAASSNQAVGAAPALPASSDNDLPF